MNIHNMHSPNSNNIQPKLFCSIKQFSAITKATAKLDTKLTHSIGVISSNPKHQPAANYDYFKLRGIWDSRYIRNMYTHSHTHLAKGKCVLTLKSSSSLSKVIIDTPFLAAYLMCDNCLQGLA